MKKASYNEGDWLSVPLNNGGYALGLIARRNRRSSKILFGYFFGQFFHDLPSLDDAQRLSACDAILICMFGDLGLYDGTWKVIGRLSHWERSSWPMPAFVRVQAISGTCYKVIYDENDPRRVISETVCDPSEVGKYPDDGLSGRGAVQIVS